MGWRNGRKRIPDSWDSGCSDISRGYTEILPKSKRNDFRMSESKRRMERNQPGRMMKGKRKDGERKKRNCNLKITFHSSSILHGIVFKDVSLSLHEDPRLQLVNQFIKK